MKLSAIYKIQSKIKPGRIYIGSSNNVKRRWDRHLQQLRNNKHHSSKLQYHYNKYGKSDLIFIITEPCLPEFLIIREQYYLDKHKPYFNGSLIAGSTLGYPAWNKGKKLTKEQSKNMGRKKGCITWMKGKSHTKESLKKMKTPRSEEGKQNMKNSKRDISGDKNPMFGKNHTKEAREKIRKSKLKIA